MTNAATLTSNGIRGGATYLVGLAADERRLVELLSNATVVLIGEASHGTEDFDRERAEITTTLIRDHGFNCIAVEGTGPMRIA